MKAFLIVSAIVTAWISGVTVGASDDAKALNGAVAFLVIAILCGMAVWVIR